MGHWISICPMGTCQLLGYKMEFTHCWYQFKNIPRGSLQNWFSIYCTFWFHLLVSLRYKPGYIFLLAHSSVIDLASLTSGELISSNRSLVTSCYRLKKGLSADTDKPSDSQPILRIKRLKRVYTYLYVTDVIAQTISVEVKWNCRSAQLSCSLYSAEVIQYLRVCFIRFTLFQSEGLAQEVIKYSFSESRKPQNHLLSVLLYSRTIANVGFTFRLILNFFAATKASA